MRTICYYNRRISTSHSNEGYGESKFADEVDPAVYFFQISSILREHNEHSGGSLQATKKIGEPRS